ncbi:hypothetical protein Ddc_19269 [Ditylenchus destructor]|nr:hypothetical protein Ddc_19269 [Ditylenchus destructor]
MRPYLGPTVRIDCTTILATGDSTYNSEHIEEMESISYLWRHAKIYIRDAHHRQIGVKDFRLIFNSPTILQCRELQMCHPHFSFKEYKVLNTVNIIKIYYHYEDETGLWLQYWHQFLEQPGPKPIVVFRYLCREDSDNFINRLSKDFISGTSPNAFKIVFFEKDEPRTEFRETNKTSAEILELKEGFSVEYKNEWLYGCKIYTLERSSI